MQSYFLHSTLSEEKCVFTQFKTKLLWTDFLVLVQPDHHVKGSIQRLEDFVCFFVLLQHIKARK